MAMKLQAAIKAAIKYCPDPEVQAALAALPQAVESGERGLVKQLQHVQQLMVKWKGEQAKAIRNAFFTYVNQTSDRLQKQDDEEWLGSYSVNTGR